MISLLYFFVWCEIRSDSTVPQLAITVRNRDICILRQFIEITADVNLSHKMSAAMFATAKNISMFWKPNLTPRKCLNVASRKTNMG